MSSRPTPAAVVGDVNMTTNSILAKVKDLEDRLVQNVRDIAKEQARIKELEDELESERKSTEFYSDTVDDLRLLLSKNRELAEQEAALKECLLKAEAENKSLKRKLEKAEDAKADAEAEAAEMAAKVKEPRVFPKRKRTQTLFFKC